MLVSVENLVFEYHSLFYFIYTLDHTRSNVKKMKKSNDSNFFYVTFNVKTHKSRKWRRMLKEIQITIIAVVHVGCCCTTLRPQKQYSSTLNTQFLHNVHRLVRV